MTNRIPAEVFPPGDFLREELEERGNAEEVLSALGWVKRNKQYEPPIEVSHTVSSFNVPVAV